MTLAPETSDLINVEIDGVEMNVPKGTLIIRAAELIGTEVPRFCDHPLLAPVAACRMCLVEIEGNPKPQPACAIELTPGMKVRTQRSSEVAEKAQQGVMEFLLANHPLDCPVCDKGGECPLQNQAMSAGRAESRHDIPKRIFDKPVPINTEILLDRERCVSCARCTRFADQIAGDPKLELLERGAKQQVGVANDEPFDSYFSGNTIQICPVGALTSSSYRFRARPFDLVSTPTTCEHCASGCSLRTDARRGEVTRRLAWHDADVNEDWNCDKGRFAFTYLSQDRINSPMIRENGELRVASWPEALDVAARGLRSAQGSTAVLTGGRLTMEDAYAYAKFARVVLGTDDIDFRARRSSSEEAAFLRASIAGDCGPTYADLDKAPIVLLVAFEPEDESPIVLLRLRAASLRRGLRVVALSPIASRGLEKIAGEWAAIAPGADAGALHALAQGGGDVPNGASIAEALRQPGAVILVGERIADVSGGPSAVAALAAATGARIGWVPRRAGERGALEAGALSGLLPGGRPLDDVHARAQLAQVWGVDAADLPTSVGRDGASIVSAAAAGGLGALVVGGLEPRDAAQPAAMRRALDNAGFVVSLETRRTEVTDRADVVLPVAVVTEKSGTFVDWEGRRRPFARVFGDALMMADGRVLAMLADVMGSSIGRGDVKSLRNELDSLGPWTGARAVAPSDSAAAEQTGGPLLVTWRLLLDDAALQEGEPNLAGTRRRTVAVVSAATAASLGVAAGQRVTVTGPAGSVSVPVEIGSIVDNAVWLPSNASDCAIASLGVAPGQPVRVSGGAA